MEISEKPVFRDSLLGWNPEAIVFSLRLGHARGKTTFCCFLHAHAAPLPIASLVEYRGNSENLDFRDSSHVLLPEAVYKYGELGRIRGKYPKISRE